MTMRSMVAVLLGLTLGSLMAFGEVKQPKPKSQKEVEALQAMFNAQDPDTRITAAEALLSKFADTEFKSIALQMEADAYQQKGDAEKVIIFCERVLELEPKSYVALVTLANTYASKTREFDLDREEKLGKAQKYAQQAIEAINVAEKPNPQLSEEQWVAAKKDLTAQAHQALGLAGAVRKKWDVAIAEYKLAVDGAASPEPAIMVRLGQAYNMAGKADDAIATLNKVLAMPQLHPTIKMVAEQERARASALKAKAAGAAPKPAAPPAAPATPAAPPATPKP